MHILRCKLEITSQQKCVENVPNLFGFPVLCSIKMWCVSNRNSMKILEELRSSFSIQNGKWWVEQKKNILKMKRKPTK